MSYTLSKQEMETIVNFDDSSQDCIIYTSSPSVIRKLDKLCTTGQYILIKQDSCSKTYKTSKSLIKFRTKAVLTEEQREKKRQIMLKNLNKGEAQ